MDQTPSGTDADPPPATGTAVATALLPSIAVVDKTISAARRTVLVCLLGAGLFVGAVLVERSWLLRESERLTIKRAAAERTAGQILLADEQLSMSARMAAATGGAVWMARYDAQLPAIDAAIARALALAPDDAARRFDTETRQANDKLVALERQAFEAVRAGEPASAKAALDSQAYADDKQVLAAGTQRFIAAMVDAVDADLEALHRRADQVVFAVAAVVLAGGLGMWRRLGASLARSRGFFVDAQGVASSDLLTGLANRVSLRDTLSALTASNGSVGRPLALMMVDLDRFKPVNDRLGHAVGDQVLQEVARRMARVLRQGELVARWGGDEFVVVLPDCGDPLAAVAIAERLVRAVSMPMVVAGHAVEVGASVGLARFPQDAAVVDDLLHRADLALYSAKAQRRGSVCAWHDGLSAAGPPLAEAAAALRQAIADGQILPFYQPIVRLADRRVQGLEILARWQHPQRGLLPPSEFIALAESCGAIAALTQAVLRRACLDARDFDPGLRLSINIAANQIEDATLADDLLAVLHETGFDPRRLEVELIEHALVRDIARARRVLGQLSQAGMTIALDDFGAGYSSLAYLCELPVDKIKIDRSFVRTLHDRAASAKTIGAIVGLSRSLGVEVIAEGVETEGDAQALQRLGCDAAQGDLFARPMAAAMVVRRAARQAASA